MLDFWVFSFYLRTINVEMLKIRELHSFDVSANLFFEYLMLC